MASTSDRIDAHVWRISAVVILGTIMSILDTTIVNVALATLGRELHATIAQIQWVIRVGGSIGTAVLAVVPQRALTGVHTLSGAAGSYGTAFWWSAGITALAIGPCVVLMRAERAACARTGEAAERAAAGALAT